MDRLQQGCSILTYQYLPVHAQAFSVVVYVSTGHWRGTLPVPCPAETPRPPGRCREVRGLYCCYMPTYLDWAGSSVLLYLLAMLLTIPNAGKWVSCQVPSSPLLGSASIPSRLGSILGSGSGARRAHRGNQYDAHFYHQGEILRQHLRHVLLGYL